MAGPMDPEREQLIERALGAHRARDPRAAVVESSAFYDLDEPGRREVFAQALALRAMEAALDPQGLSTTVRAVLRLLDPEGE